MSVVDPLVLGNVPPRVWDDFHAGRHPALAPDLARCWQRAADLGAPVLGARPEDGLVRGAELRARAEEIELVQSLGDAILDRSTARASERDFLLLLADPDGVVVRTSGGGGFADFASRVRLIEGACWSEAARGTNAIGTAATTNQPTQVHGRAHFGKSYGELVCYAAPVRGLDGRPIAIVDATSRVERADPAIARLIAQTARALEQLVRLRGYAHAGATVTRTLGRTLDRLREPALLVEAPGTVARANAAARELLGAPMVGGDVADALGLDWRELAREGLCGTAGGKPIVIRTIGTIGAGRAFRLRVELIAAPTGAVLAALVVLEPGRLLNHPTAAHVPAAAQPAVADLAGDPFAAICHQDRGVADAVAWARKLAPSELPIMLLAETGAGKELFARAIHDASPRADGPWHAVNCGALAPGVLEAELFGYAPGAFTGAERGGHDGLFHAATGGTLFLDEVAEMSPAMQAALLRVVETGTYRRVGDPRLERCDVRLVCATCRDLPALVTAGAFRQDLFYRLKGATVRIPALRVRTDVALLAHELLAGKAAIAPDALAAITRYPWPGNVRELKSALAVALVASDGRWIAREHLPPEVAGGAEPGAPGQAGGQAPLLASVERDAVVRALVGAAGNVSHAARALGVARSTLQRLKRRYRLD